MGIYILIGDIYNIATHIIYVTYGCRAPTVRLRIPSSENFHFFLFVNLD